MKPLPCSWTSGSQSNPTGFKKGVRETAARKEKSGVRYDGGRDLKALEGAD